MKRFLSLFILTGLLFGQDVLTLKNGESYKGTYIGKVGEDIVFKVPLTSSVSSIFLKRITSTKKFPIWSVETIVTKNGELTYPFDIPTKELSKQDVLLHKTGKNYKGTFLGKIDEDNSGFWKRASEAYVTGNQDEFLRQNMKPSPIPSYMVIPCALILVSILVVLGGGGVSM